MSSFWTGNKTVELDFNKKYGRLTLVTRLGVKGKKGVVWSCRCDCGNKIKVQAAYLASGHTKSCGCLQKEAASKTGKANKGNKHNQTHDMTKTPEYVAWGSMKDRCYRAKCKDYKNYGGRNIKVCERWLNSFENFYADLGPKPFPKILYSLDRINNNGNYEPSNCKWSTNSQQSNNRRPRSKK